MYVIGIIAFCQIASRVGANREELLSPRHGVVSTPAQRRYWRRCDCGRL